MIPTTLQDHAVDATEPVYDYWRRETHWQRTKRLRETQRREDKPSRERRWKREQRLRDLGSTWQPEWEERA